MDLAEDMKIKMLECLGYVIKSGYNIAEKISEGKPCKIKEKWEVHDMVGRCTKKIFKG
jgi:hypothetical protein